MLKMSQRFERIEELEEIFESNTYMSYPAALELQELGRRYYPAEGRWCTQARIDGEFHTFT